MGANRGIAQSGADGEPCVGCCTWPPCRRIRYNDDLSRFYQGLRKRGKTGKVAVVAVMRKLLLLLNAIAHRGTPWVEHHAPAG